MTLKQAILQHYGFRSFYLDCSASAAVSAWFASHRYSERMTVELCEDCHEDPLLLRKKMAHYDPADGQGQLYVLDRAACEAVGLTDLTAISVAGTRTRPSVQRAHLLGPLQNQPLPADCFLAHIEADCAVLRELANEAGFFTTNDMFPSATDDPILNTLLGLPWNPIAGVPNNDKEIPAFRRAIELPEYDDSFVKIASPTMAFYQGGNIADFLDIDAKLDAGAVIHISDVIIFGSTQIKDAPVFSYTKSLLDQHGSLIFEAPALIKIPSQEKDVFYEKGLTLDLVEPDLVHLGPLLVRHPGLQIDAAGFGIGWYYRIDGSGVWRHEVREDECPCGSDRPHLRHLAALHIVEDLLTTPTGSSEDDDSSPTLGSE